MAGTWSSPRTPPKNKGAGPLSLEGFVDDVDHAHKATWDSAATSIFLECVRDEILADRRVGTTITVVGYKELTIKFAKRTSRCHKMKQLKNKYGSLKNEWLTSNKLMDNSKGVTGIGFDREIGLFTASEEWLESLNQYVPK
ncbi:hypothetical protein CsSME_00003853 [Camellia sinensis var. sinensis]